MNRTKGILPKYFQVEQQLRSRVSSLPPGTLLPSEPELAKEYEVSRVTLRVAVDALALDGLVTRVQGRGTFVSQNRLDIPVGYRRDRRADQAGKAESLAHHRLTGFDRIAAGAELGELFGIRAPERVLRVERITYIEDMPLGIGTLALPDKLAKGLKRSDFEQGRFFDTLVGRGIDIVRYRLVIESSVIGAALAQTLGLRAGLPAISLTRTGFGRDGRAIVRVDILTRGDVGRYVLDSSFSPAKTRMRLALARESGW
jgi:GntR family transcriptional regulator